MACPLSMGSSPRMRGSPTSDDEQAPTVGIIPAHAGLTATLLISCASIRAHPRACGAHFDMVVIDESSSGSSPRMRGSRERIRAPADYDGIIPAHAGLTASFFFLLRGSRDHPRACGAHRADLRCNVSDWGSSPRMRGSLLRRPIFHSGHGIIPAHAGLTLLLQNAKAPPRDHPRACGAHIARPSGVDVSKGSSPRMRGSRVVVRHGDRIRGIIPAHAGLTPLRSPQ